MGSFLSRNGLAALFFLGLMMFGISNLVGSEGEDGLLMKAAHEFTGGESSEAVEKEVSAAPHPEVAAPPTPPVASESGGGFFDDAELIDSASGYNPSPMQDSGVMPDSESDEAVILPQPRSQSQPQSRPQPAGPSGPPVAGGLVGGGIAVIPADNGEDDE